jgi:guanylate kinase
MRTGEVVNMAGKIVIISSPSGAGKTTIVHRLLERHPDFMFSVSATTRPMRDGEINGKDYYFLTEDEFKRKIEAKEFAEWEQVYKGKFYGTLKSEIERIWSTGKTGIFDIDVKGALSLKGVYGLQALTIFIAPPSFAVLEDRLKKRGTEGPDALKERIDRASLEMEFRPRFDASVVNDDLENALDRTEKIVEMFIKG